MNSTVASRVGLPVVALTQVNSVPYLSMTYTRNKVATDIVFSPEWSSDLATWSNSGITENIILDGNTTQQVQDLIPINPGTRKFMHLRVTMP